MKKSKSKSNNLFLILEIDCDYADRVKVILESRLACDVRIATLRCGEEFTMGGKSSPTAIVLKDTIIAVFDGRESPCSPIKLQSLTRGLEALFRPFRGDEL